MMYMHWPLSGCTSCPSLWHFFLFMIIYRIICLCQLYSDSILLMKNSFVRVEHLYHILLGNILVLHGEGNLVSSLNKNAKNQFVFVVPPFPFTISFAAENEEVGRHWLLVLPNAEEPKSHFLVCVKWPMVHPNRHCFGKPVEVWCNIYEPSQLTGFFQQLLLMLVLLSALKRFLVIVFVLLYHLLSESYSGMLYLHIV